MQSHSEGSRCIMHNSKEWAQVVHQRDVSSVTGFAAAIELAHSVGAFQAYPSGR